MSAGQKGFGVYIKAFDPVDRSTGVSSIIFVQDGNEWRYIFYPRKNISLILYPSLASGKATIVVADVQGNNATTTIQYVKPETGYNLWETILVLAITSTVLIALLIITRSSE